MIRLALILFLFSCGKGHNNQTDVRITMDTSQYGWHFISITIDSTLEKNRKIILKQVSKELQRIKVSDINETSFWVFDPQGKEISDRMKLGAITKRGEDTFFAFYNPTQEDLFTVKQWMPIDWRYEEIQRLSHLKLDSILAEQ